VDEYRIQEVKSNTLLRVGEWGGGEGGNSLLGKSQETVPAKIRKYYKLCKHCTFLKQNPLKKMPCPSCT
jgi:hypothetical protein